MRFITWAVNLLAVLGRGADSASGGPGVPVDEARRRQGSDTGHRAREEYRP